MSFYSWLFTKKIANRFFLRVFKLPVPEWFVGQSGSSKVERDYFDDDWDPDDDDRTIDDEDRSVDDDNRNLDDEDEKKKVKKGQARWRIHLHF